MSNVIHLNLTLLEFTEICFLKSNFFCRFNILWIMSKYLAPDSIFQGRNNTTTIGIILRIGSENKENIQRKTQFKSSNLHIPLLQNIKQSNLNARLQIR